MTLRTLVLLSQLHLVHEVLTVVVDELLRELVPFVGRHFDEFVDAHWAPGPNSVL